MLESQRSFKSDNYSGIHPEVLQAIVEANQGHATAYAEDSLSIEVKALIQKIFQKPCEVVYVLNGTGANVLSLKLCLRPGESVLLADSSHLNVNESGAPESVTGAKLLAVKTNSNSKITPEAVRKKYQAETLNSYHATLPKVLSISQATELGTVYSIAELQALKTLCLELDLYLHIDACRIYNAAEYLKVELSEITSQVGADLISFGGTKNGAMLAEAVVIFNPELQKNYRYIQKNTLQLYSKNRYAAAQYKALLQNDLWLRSARQANSLARNLEKQILSIPNLKVVYPVEANMLFLETTRELANLLLAKGLCYLWSEDPCVVRLVLSFDNTEADLIELLNLINS